MLMTISYLAVVMLNGWARGSCHWILPGSLLFAGESAVLSIDGLTSSLASTRGIIGIRLEIAHLSRP